ncbi:hypothetical protein CGLO_17476 [Colletotrichum gloeosporioides Cg-14]|uniref:Protein kinase domain-containing protein n=1 Tax=Colletotrichum gloeosporioides (strain Cg-14) TaxID=1237896 RepID=T0KWT0_COLGC|nr:hypothetical protein CGLO_17476 [Colletotrichum gloeosporioides Cg-14]
MDFSQSGFPTFRQKAPVPSPIDDSIVGSNADNIGGSSRCPHFAGFLSVCLSGDTDLGLHPFITNILPTFEDVTIGGRSFDVRKVKTSSFLSGLEEGILKGRDFVIVKHPKASFATAQGDSGAFADAATELQILRHPPLKGHDNITELLAVMYHDTGEPLPGVPRIMPALVLEHAEHGSLKTFQEQGGGSSFVDQIQIAIDTAQGLKALHDCGIIHGDVKPSNLLVCRHETRSFIVKLSDFEFSLSSGDTHIIGHSEFFCAPESYGENIRPPYLEQLDIYCYGLTLLTIFESGSTFYDSFPTEGLEDNLRKMKSSGIMSTLIPLRFASISQQTISIHGSDLESTRSFETCSKLSRICPFGIWGWYPGTTSIDSLRELTSKPPIIQGTPADVFSTVFHRLAEGVIGNLPPGSGSVRMLAIYAKKLHDTTAQVVQMLLLINKIAMQGDSFENSLYNLIEKRVMGGFVQACGGARDQQESTEVSVKFFVSFLVDLKGLTPDPGSIPEQASAVSSQQLIVHDKLNFRRSLDFIPDLRNTAGIYQKMPKRIQKDLVQSLGSICSTSTDDKLRAAAAFSIAVAHVNGVGVRLR